MEPNIFDKVHDIDLKKTMEKSYIDYAMSVIAARALPDVRLEMFQAPMPSILYCTCNSTRPCPY